MMAKKSPWQKSKNSVVVVIDGKESNLVHLREFASQIRKHTDYDWLHSFDLNNQNDFFLPPCLNKNAIASQDDVDGVINFVVA